MGNVDLLPQEKETVSQNLPQVVVVHSFRDSIICHEKKKTIQKEPVVRFFCEGGGVTCLGTSVDQTL